MPADASRNRSSRGDRPWSSGELLASLYDWEHDGFQDDVALYAGLARRTGGPALELACGSGRVLEGLIREGVDVVGVDRDPAMLARAKARLHEAPCAVSLVQADLQDPFPSGPFALVVLALDALGLIHEPAQQLDLLRRVHASLAPGGLMAVDVVHAPPFAGQPEGIPVLQRIGRDEELGAHITKWMVRRVRPAVAELDLLSFYDIVWGDGTFGRQTSDVGLRYFSRHEVELLLLTVGFAVEAVYGDYQLGLLGDESERMIFVAGQGNPHPVDGIQSVT